MKKQRKGETTIHLSSPTEGGGMRVYDDLQGVVYEMCPGDSHTMENGSRSVKGGLSQVTSRDGRGKVSSPSNVVSNGQGQRDTLINQKVPKDSMWMNDFSSQAYSGPEDNSTDPHETLTESSTLTFVDAHTIDDSVESHSLLGLGVGLVHIKEFVLIDDDDDGDMSLREMTVTDMSTMDGNAADLVCGRLLSTSSCSLSECKEENPDPSPPPPEEPKPPPKKRGCCFCTIL